MQSAKDQVIAQFLSVFNEQRVVGFPVATLSVTYFFYGIYIILMILCVSLLRHDRFENRRFYLVFTLLLFAICTIMVVDMTILRTREAAMECYFATTKDPEPYLWYMFHDKPKLAYYTLYYAVPPLANTVAEAMLIHRCYLVWGQRKRIALPLATLSLVGSLFCLGAGILAAVGMGDLRSKSSSKLIKGAEKINFAGTVASIIVNVAVTLLTAGRIWQINRQSEIHMCIEKDAKRFSTAIRIILESGIIYPTVMVIQMIVFTGVILKGAPARVDLYPVVVLSAGIAPTLAIVRAQIVKMSEKASPRLGFECVSDIRFKDAQLAVLFPPSTGMSSISSDGDATSDVGELRPPKPLVYPRQAVELPSSLHPLEERQARVDVEKGVH